MQVNKVMVQVLVYAMLMVNVVPEDRRLLTIRGVDCRTPKRTRYGLRGRVCNITEDSVTEQPARDALILMRSPKQEIKAFTCEKFVSQLDTTCGAYSHQKLIEPPSILEPVAMKDDACKGIIKHGLYNTEDGQVLTVQPDQEISYKYVPIGTLYQDDGNSYCTGGMAYLQGRAHTSVVRMRTVRLRIMTVSLEHDIGAQHLVDVTNHVPLRSACLADLMCSEGTRTYYIPMLSHECPFYPVRALPLTTAYVPADNARGTDKLLVSHEHKMLLEELESAPIPHACSMFGIRGSLAQTNIPSIFVTFDPTTMEGFTELSTVLPPSSVNAEIELKTTGEYLAYVFETQLRKKVRLLHSSLCRLNEGQILAADLSPFHENALIRVRGDVVQEMLCAPVDVTVEIGTAYQGSCYDDAIVGRIGSEFVLIKSQNKMVINIADGQKVHCESVMPPIFMTKEGQMVTAQPQVKPVTLQLEDIDLDVRHALEIDGQILHEEFKSDLFYTEAEMSQFNDLVHWERTRSSVVNSLVQRYCANADCGSYAGPAQDVSTFDPDHLLAKVNPFSWWQTVKEDIILFGNACSVIVVCYLCFGFMKCIWSTGRLILTDQLPVPEALRFSVGLTDLLQRRLVAERTMGTAVVRYDPKDELVEISPGRGEPVSSEPEKLPLPPVRSTSSTASTYVPPLETEVSVPPAYPGLGLPRAHHYTPMSRM